MLNYLLAHPELTFSPPDTADLCEAFDMAIAVLQERDDNSVNWTIDNARVAVAALIVEGWQRGERDPRRLGDYAVETVGTEVASEDR